MLKNVSSQSITTLMLTASGTPLTSGTTVVRYTGDDGTQAGSGTATHKGSGQWGYNPTQAETNFNQVGFLFINSGGISVERTVYTRPIDAGSLNTQVGSLFAAVDSLHTRVSSVAVEVDSIQSYAAAILEDTGTSGVVLAADQSGVTVGTVNAIAGTITTLDALDTAQDTQHTTTRAAVASLDTRVSSAAVQVGSNAVAISSLGGTSPTAAQIADAVWGEAIADHSGTAGSTAESLNAAGGSGDPWVTALPASYTTGQAGHILGTVLANSLYTMTGSVSAGVAAIPTDAASTWTAIGSLQTAVSSAVYDQVFNTAASEPTSVPAANASIADKLGWLHITARNKATQNGSLQTVYADNGSTIISSASVSDDGDTFTRGKFN